MPSSCQSKFTHFLLRLRDRFLQIGIFTFFDVSRGDNWGQEENSAKHFPNKAGSRPIEGFALRKMESGDRVALLARVALYPTSIPRVPEYTRIDGRIDGVELLLSNPDPGFPGSLNTHTESQGGRQR